MQVGLGPGHIVLDGDPAFLPQRGTAPAPVFSPCISWPNGWMDQDGTWHGGGPRSRPHCARWGNPSPLPQKGAEPPIFGPFLMWPNGWMDQDGTWYGGRPRPRRLCSMGTQLPRNKAQPQPIFGPCLLWSNGWMDEDTTWYGSRPRPRPHCVTGTQLSHKRGRATRPPLFGPCSIVTTVARLCYC